MGNVITRNSRTDRLRVFILGVNVGHVTRRESQLFKVKRAKVEVTRSRDVSADKNAITRQCMHISTSNLVGIIYVWVYACGLLSRSVSRNMADIQNKKMQYSTENVAKSPKFCTPKANRGRWIKRRCLNLHQKFINNRFCACAVQMFCWKCP